MAFDAVLVGTPGTDDVGPLVTGGGTSTASGSTFVIVGSYDGSATMKRALNNLDNKSNTYVSAGTILTANGHSKAIWYCTNGAGGASHVATLSFTASVYGTAYLIEITDAAASSFDKYVSGTDAISPYTVATGTLAQADSVVITLIGNHNGTNPMNYASSNTTVLGQEGDGSQFWTSAVSKQVVASTSTFSPSFTSAYAGDHSLVAAVFKKIAGGGGSSILRQMMMNH